MLSPTKFAIATPRINWELSKLPIVGEAVTEDNYDFEWPTKEVWGQIGDTQGLKLKSMDIWYEMNDGYYCSFLKVKVTLINFILTASVANLVASLSSSNSNFNTRVISALFKVSEFTRSTCLQ